MTTTALDEPRKGQCPICLTSSYQRLIKHDQDLRPELSWLTVDVVQCLACRSVFVHREDIPLELVESLYDDEPRAGFEMNIENFGWWRRNIEDAMQPILSLLQSEPRGPLLDVGCGRGVFACMASEHGWPVTGLELDSRAVTFVQDTLGIDAVQGTIFSETLREHHYAVITLIDVLEHIYHPVNTLKRCAELLRPGGVVVVKVPHWRMQYVKESIKKMLQVGTGDIAGIGHLNQFDRRSLCLAFQKAGLDPIRVGTARSFLPALRGAPFSLKRTLGYGVLKGINTATECVWWVTGWNLSFNMLGSARRSA